MTSPQPFDLASHAIGPGLSVIEASAGTGKTWSLSHLVVDALLEDPALTLDQVLVVTFTNAAADELAGRVRGVLDEVREIVEADDRPSATREREDLPSATRRSQELASDSTRLQTPDPRPQTISGAATLLARRSGAYEPAALTRRIRALRQNLDQLQVHTIHGFCRRVLERCAFECGAAFDLELAIDLADLHQQVVDDGWRRALVDRPLLAAIAQLDGWTPEKDLAVVKPTTRLDRWTVEPADLDLDRELAAVVEAWAGVRRAWSPGLATGLGALKWNKAGAEWETQVADLAQAVAEGVAAEGAVADGAAQDPPPAALPSGGLRAARWLALDHLETIKAVHAKDVAKLADLPALVACQTLARALDRVRPAWLSSLLAWFPGAVATAKRLARRRSSDDLLLEVAAALDGERGAALRAALREAHRVVLIDEFQDTDPVQWGIFARCFAEPPTRLVLIGDPKQAIYGFRGCDLKTYLRAVAGTAPWHLQTNFRSAPGMVAAVNALFAGSQPFADPAIAFHAATSAANAKGSSAPLVDADDDGVDGAALRFVVPTAVASGAADGLGAWIAGEFRRLLGRATLGDRPLRPGDLAVLVRSNAQAVTVREHLRQAGLPAVIAEQEDLLASPAARDLLALLGAVLEPRHSNRLRAALATRLGGFDAEALVALNRDDGRWQAVLEQVASISRTWRERGVAAAVERLLHEPWLADLDQAGPESAAVRLAGGPDGERHLMDLRHAGEWLAAEADERHLGPVALLRTVAQARRNPAGEERRRRLESDAEAVQVVTMHKAKGLEYPVVACPFLWNSRDSDQDEALVVRGDDGATVIDLGSPERERRLADRVADRLAEDLRLAYVALTRARNRTYVAWGPLSSSKIRPILSSALGWLLRPGGDTAANAQQAWEARLQLDLKKAADRPDPARILAEPVERLAQAQPGAIGIEWWDPEAEPAASPRLESGVWGLVAGAAGSSAEANADAGAAVHSSFIDHHSSFPAERLPRPWRISSFTALTSQHGQRHAAEPDDRPQADDPARSRSEAGDDAAALARGAALGTCLHGLLERSRGVTVPTAEEIREALHQAGLADPALHQGRDSVAVVGTILEWVPTIVLGGATLLEADLLRPEWPFHLPVAELSVAAIARAFRDHGGPLAATANALAGLDSHQLAGAFTGIVDLIIRWPVTDGGSRWAVLDWKTNYLGPDASAYTAEALEQSMAEHRYVLQGCLYLVALRRWLRHRDPALPTDWTGDLHYVYLRGLAGPLGGVWTARPAVELLDALEAAFATSRMMNDALPRMMNDDR